MSHRRIRYDLALFCIPWVSIVCFFTYVLGYSHIKQSHASRNYVCVNAVGVSSTVEQSSGDGESQTTYTPYIFYRYEVGGKVYESSRYYFAGSSFDYHEAHYAAEYHKPGSQFVAFYDPENPHEAVLDPSPLSQSSFLFFAAFIFFFWGFTLLILYGAFFSKRAEDDAPHS